MSSAALADTTPLPLADAVRPGARPLARQAIDALGVGVVYYLSARLGLLLQLPGTNASAVWPPSGIGLAAVLVWGTHVCPGIAAAAFLANLFTLPNTTAGMVAAAGIAIGNTFEQLSAAYLLRRLVRGDNPFSTARDSIRFVGVCVVSALVAASSGTSVLRFAGIIASDLHASAWITWWVGDLAGMVVLTPPLVGWARRGSWRVPTPHAIELACLTVAALAAADLMFRPGMPLPFAVLRPYVLTPVLLWAVFRFSPREASSVVVVIAAVTVSRIWSVMAGAVRPGTSAAVGFSPFFDFTGAPNEWLLSIQVFICVAAVLTMVVAAAVSDRLRSERALAYSEQRLRTIFEQAAVGVALVETATGRFLRVNRRFAEIVGRTPDEMLSLTFVEITHVDDLQRGVENVQRLTAGEVGQFAMEKRYYRSDGSTVWVNLTVSPTWQAGERPQHHIAIIEDITQRKQAEQRLVHANQTLEERVRERTTELQHSLEEKDTLLREIHHRVKNNLAVVSSLFYLESSRTTDAHTMGVLRDAQHRVKSMAMVHEELYRSRNLAAVEAPEYLTSLTEYLLRSYANVSTGVKLKTEVERLRLDVDTAVPCGLILTELLTNCFKHAFPRGRFGTITVSLRQDDEAGVVLTVHDNGVGIGDHVALDNASSLGWRLVGSLSKQLDGTFGIRRTETGTEARLTFPMKAGVA